MVQFVRKSLLLFLCCHGEKLEDVDKFIIRFVLTTSVLFLELANQIIHHTSVIRSTRKKTFVILLQASKELGCSYQVKRKSSQFLTTLNNVVNRLVCDFLRRGKPEIRVNRIYLFIFLVQSYKVFKKNAKFLFSLNLPNCTSQNWRRTATKMSRYWVLVIIQINIQTKLFKQFLYVRHRNEYGHSIRTRIVPRSTTSFRHHNFERKTSVSCLFRTHPSGCCSLDDYCP